MLIINKHIEGVMYKGLDYLKERNGPFTTADKVKEFDDNTPDSPEKNSRLYIEVRYAKNSCLSLKHTASIFRVKRDHRNLSSAEYVENLCQYLSDVRSKTSLTTDDLSLVLEELTQKNNDDVMEDLEPLNKKETHNEKVRTSSNSEVHYPDEHVAAVWIDENDNVLTWFLGVVNSISTDTIDVTYYNRKDREGVSWTLPFDDTSEPVTTPKEHVIFRNITKLRPN